MGPKQPNLHVVGGNRTANPPENQYKTAFVTAIVTGVGTVLATLGVQWIVGRASRKNREEEERFMRQQLMLQQPFMTSAQQQQMIPPPGYILVPAPMQQPVAAPPAFPQALTFPATRRRRSAPTEVPANGAPPAWFAAWAKKQDARFKQIEQQLADVDEEYEDEDEETG